MLARKYGREGEGIWAGFFQGLEDLVIYLIEFIYLVWLVLLHQNVKTEVIFTCFTDMANMPPAGFLVRFVKKIK